MISIDNIQTKDIIIEVFNFSDTLEITIGILQKKFKRDLSQSELLLIGFLYGQYNQELKNEIILNNIFDLDNRLS